LNIFIDGLLEVEGDVDRDGFTLGKFEMLGTIDTDGEGLG